MKRKIKNRIVEILFLGVFILSFCVLPVCANSVQKNWEGVDSTGAIIVDDDSPIIVEKELLTFDIQEFPESYYNNLEEYLAYSGKVSAEYTFYNPADYTVTATLLFPFGCEPMYALDYDNDTQVSYSNADTEKFDITVDGKAIEKTLRCTLSSGVDQFDLENDLALMHNDYVEDDFYSTDLTVTKYIFEVSDVDIETYSAADAGFDVDRNDAERKIYFAEQNGCQTLDNGKMRIHSWSGNGKTMTVYVIGKDFDTFPEWKFYENGAVEDEETIDGTMSLVSREALTFKEFALKEWSEESGVSEIDWYNAIVAMFNDTSQSQGSILFTWSYSMDLDSCLMRWYEYEITLESGQRIVNKVTAPIYPSINLNYDPAVYKYTYLLSPAKTWTEFGGLEVVINTPYYISESSLGDFSKTEAGYTQKFSGLPDGELKFTLSESEIPEIPGKTIVYCILARILGVGIIALIVIFRKKKGSKREKKDIERKSLE